MPPPTTITELRRFMGVINQLGKFSPNTAELSAPLHTLLSTNQAWFWGPDQDRAFNQLKTELTTPHILTMYDPKAQTKISADASSFGLGAVLLQAKGTSWHPVAYASRSMTSTERRYAQIEKEALAITWACEKFSSYIIGNQILLETDHKPLVPLLTYKHLENLPPKVLRFRLRLMRFDYNIVHVAGKYLHTADLLSRVPQHTSPDAQSLSQQEDIEYFIQSVTSYLPASEKRLQVYRQEQSEDPVTKTVISYCQSGWPKHSSLQKDLIPFWPFRGELSLYNGLLLYGSHIVVPVKLHTETLEKIHHGHQGINRCLLRSVSSVWWPGVSKAVEAYVKSCPHCQKTYIPPREPLIILPLPQRPWERVAADLFELDGTQHLLIIDYYSRYPEVIQLLQPL